MKTKYDNLHPVQATAWTGFSISNFIRLLLFCPFPAYNELPEALRRLASLKPHKEMKSMIEDAREIRVPHNIIIEGRKNLSITGVTDIESFDESEVCLVTSMGSLTLLGEKFHLTKSNVETGELVMEGYLTSASYSDIEPERERGGVFGKLFGR